jgi:hypothetical protein
VRRWSTPTMASYRPTRSLCCSPSRSNPPTTKTPAMTQTILRVHLDRYLGSEFTMKGVKDHTYRLIWASQSQDVSGVIASWDTSRDPVVYTVRGTALRLVK